jgi:molecular chaperone GrpE
VAAGTGDATGQDPSVAELEDRWCRAVAELDNVRQRFERQLADTARAERAGVAAAFVPVLDNLELALRHADADPAAVVAGVRAVHARPRRAGRLGFARIDPAGEPFDPTRHEAARVAPAAAVPSRALWSTCTGPGSPTRRAGWSASRRHRRPGPRTQPQPQPQAESQEQQE